MSLLDLPEDLFSIQSSLIPRINSFHDNLDDIYFIGQTPLKRWKTFISENDKDLKDSFDRLIKKREYHLKMVTETCILISFTDETWLSIPSILMVRDIGYYELRCSEIELISFQLTTNQIAINTSNKKKLYEAALNLQTTQLWLVDKVLGKKTREQKLIYSSMVRDGPNYSDSIKEMAKSVDRLLFGLQELIKRWGLLSSKAQNDTGFLLLLSNKLKACILTVDKVLFVKD